MHAGKQVPVAVLLCAGLLLTAKESSAATPCYPGTAQSPLEPTMVVDTTGGSFSDAFKKAVIEPFEADCGVAVTINLNTLQSLGQLRAFVRQGQVPYDVGSIRGPIDYPTALKANLIEALPAGFWDPIKDQLIPGSFDSHSTWQTLSATVLVFDNRFHSDPPKTWADYWNVDKWPGSRGMQDDPSNFVIALIADGMPMNEIQPLTDDKIKRAVAKLDQIRPSIRTFYTALDIPSAGINRGDFVMATAPNGRAYAAMKQGYKVEFDFNQALVISNYLFIPKGARSPKAAAAFMYYYNHPKPQASLAEMTGYTGGAVIPPARYRPTSRITSSRLQRTCPGRSN